MEDMYDDTYVPEEPQVGAGYTYIPTAEDMQIPRLRLAQMLTPEVVADEARGGDWLVPGEGNQKEVRVTILGMKVGRVRAVRGEGDKREVLCSADSAKAYPLHGVGDPGIACSGCPFAEWTGDDNNRKPPECTKGYNYMVQTEMGTVADLGMSEKSASRAAKQINAYFGQCGGQPGVLTVTLTSELKTAGQRRYYVPVVKGVEMAGGMPKFNGQQRQQIASGPSRRYDASGSPMVDSPPRREVDEDGVPFSPPPASQVAAGEAAEAKGADKKPTKRQLEYLYNLAVEAGYEGSDLDDHAEGLFGAPVDDLNRAQVSELLDEVKLRKPASVR